MVRSAAFHAILFAHDGDQQMLLVHIGKVDSSGRKGFDLCNIFDNKWSFDVAFNSGFDIVPCGGEVFASTTKCIHKV